MNPDQGFVDLRLNRQEGQTEESFWPSFTDIMTVIVMIFMLAMVILLLRNMELVDQLRATMQAERDAAELARATGAEKETLAGKLAMAERDILLLRAQVQQLDATREQQEAAIASQRHQIQTLYGERDRLRLESEQRAAQSRTLQTELESVRQEHKTGTQELAGLRERHSDLSSNYERALATLEKLRQHNRDLEQTREVLQARADEHTALRQRHEQTNREVEELRIKLQIQEQALVQALARLEEADLSLSSLQEDYSSLQLKYDDLVKPARSAEGRFVVEVRVAKEQGEIRISYRETRDQAFQPVSRADLDAVLSRRKEEHEQDLYIRVIIPEDSGLSYNEAWKFTSDIHSRYDYYFQEK